MEGALPNVFEQKRGTGARKFTLFRDKLLIETKTIKKINKFELKLDRIGNDIEYQSERTILGKIFLYMCVALPIVLIIIHYTIPNQVDSGSLRVNMIISWGLALFGYFSKPKDDILLVGGQIALAFSNEEKVLSFINEIITTSKNYLKEKYGKVDLNIPEEIFIGRLNWLKEREVIDDAEFYELKNEYSIKKLL